MSEDELRELVNTIANDAAGFDGTFVFDPEHTEDHGIGNIAEVHDFDDRLMFVPTDGDLRGEESHVIIDCVEQHVAEPLARMLNGAGRLAAEVGALLDENARLKSPTALHPFGDVIEKEIAEKIAKHLETESLAHYTEESKRYDWAAPVVDAIEDAIQDIREGAWRPK